MPDNFRLRLDLVEYCKRMYDKGLVGGTQGNASVRLDTNSILITPTGSNLGYLKPHELGVISLKGRKLAWQNGPSSEYLLHLGIYQKRDDINAICHAHPVAVTACSIVDIDLNEKVLPEIINQLGSIAIIEYAAPGTPGLFARLEPMLENRSAFILRNHGAVTLGNDLEDAFNKMEMLERYAQTLLIAKQYGPLKHLPDDSIRQFLGIRQENEKLSGR
jgi:L-fuculose-phosphate aldolase